MSAVFEPMSVPPPEDGRTRFRFALQPPDETKKQSAEEMCNRMLLWLDANLPSLLARLSGDKSACRIRRREWQHPVGVAQGPNDFIDLYAVCDDRMWPTTVGHAAWIAHEMTNTVAFLLVPGRISLREVVRRVRCMQAYEKCRYVVVSPDDRFQEALAGQGIDFLLYDQPPVTQLSPSASMAERPQ